MPSSQDSSSRRIVLFGATGYTGDGVARALVRLGERPLLAARSPQKLAKLAEELGGLDTAIADAQKPESLRALVQPGDVLVSTVGPFVRFGEPAVEAAVAAGAIYIDSTGEAPFIRRVFEHHGPRAAQTGASLLTAFGFDWVPGNLAAALALEAAGEQAAQVDIAYFAGGGTSGGTRVSAALSALDGSFAFRGGQLRREPVGQRVKDLDVPGLGTRRGISVGGSEHFALPARFAQLRDVDVLLGQGGNMVKAMPLAMRAFDTALAIPGLRKQVKALAARRIAGSTGGPSAEARQKSRSTVTAVARDARGGQLSQVTLGGVNAYTFTFEILAWAARRLAGEDALPAGALSPLDAFSLAELERGVAEAGISRIGS